MSGFFAPSEQISTESTGLKDFSHAAPEQEASPLPDIEHYAEEPEDHAEGASQEDAEPSHEAMSESEPDSTVEATPRAQRRIQDLARQKRELSQQNAELQSLVEQMRRQADLSEQTLLRQQQAEERAQAHLAPQMRRQQMLEAGLNPASAQDQFLFDMYHEKEALKQQIDEVRRASSQSQGMAAVQGFQANVAENIQQSLARYDVDTETFKEVFASAMESAYARDLTAEQAAYQAVQRFQKFLRPRTTKRPDELTQSAIRATSVQGRSGGKAPGVQNQKPRGFNGYLDAMFGGRR